MKFTIVQFSQTIEPCSFQSCFHSPLRRFQSLLFDCHPNLLNYIFIVDSRCQKLILRPRLFWLNTAFALNNHTIELVSGNNSHEEGSNVQYMFEMEHAFTIASNKTFPFRGKIHNSWAVYLFIITTCLKIRKLKLRVTI